MNTELIFDITVSDGFTGFDEFVDFGTNMQSYVRDIRFHNSVLSQEKITEIYQEKMNIDSIGNLLTNISCDVPYVSPQTVNELGWVGGNDINDARGESEPCSGLLNYEDALAYAHAQGGRLPTIYELENNIAKGTGCSYDDEFCWTCEKGKDSSEHWVVAGDNTRGLGPPQLRSNNQTAYVRMVAENDTNRNDPVTVNDSVIKRFLINV